LSGGSQVPCSAAVNAGVQIGPAQDVGGGGGAGAWQVAVDVAHWPVARQAMVAEGTDDVYIPVQVRAATVPAAYGVPGV
jgi:hypothetical protein